MAAHVVVTLAWFSPVNPDHRNFREAKLELSPVGGWGDLPLKLARQDADHNQVLRGTVQHEVVEGSKANSGISGWRQCLAACRL